jgi:hypothetical protein
MGLDHQVGPDFGFADQPDFRPPVVEEAAHVARHIERQELVDGRHRQTAGEQIGRGDGAGGDQHIQPARQQP